MFWKLTFLIFFLNLTSSGFNIKSEEVTSKDLAIAFLLYFAFCMLASNCLIDILAVYGIKPL